MVRWLSLAALTNGWKWVKFLLKCGEYLCNTHKNIDDLSDKITDCNLNMAVLL